MKTRAISKFFFLIILQLFITGCGNSEPIWEDIKITDLAPANSPENPDNIKTVSFDIHKIEFPADRMDEVKEIYEDLQTSALSLNSTTGFKENLFQAGLGQKQTWEKLNQVYKKANAEVKSSMSYIINFDQPNYIPAARIDPAKKLYYHQADGNLKKAVIKNSELTFRITARRIANRKGFCRLYIVPAFRNKTSENRFESFLKEGSGNQGNIFNDSVFESTAFNVEISRGDFILIGPEKFVPHQYTLPAVLFCSQQPKPVFRIFLILCKQIKS